MISILLPSTTHFFEGVMCRNISGTKLRELLIKHGSFKNVEMHLEKYVLKRERNGKRGRWVTRQYLMDMLKYTKQL